MLVHCPDEACRDVRAKLFGFIGERGQDLVQRALVARPVSEARAAQQLFAGAATIGNEHRYAACPCLADGEAECLRLAAVNEAVRAGEQSRDVASVADVADERDRRVMATRGFELSALAAFADY